MQELDENYYNRRLQSSKEMSNHITNNPNLLFHIRFSDQLFFLNRHKCQSRLIVIQNSLSK